MTRFAFDRSEKNIDLTSLHELNGSVSGDQVKGDLKRVLDATKPGNFCVVTEGYTNGGHYSKTRRIFQIGEGRILANHKNDSAALGMDVQVQTNPSSQAKEAVVLEEGCLRTKLLHSMPQVRISTNGISHMRFFNEGTFSPAPGIWIDHPIGSSIDSITLGQRKIKKDFPQEIKELKLRAGSIPFILPSEYFRPIFRGVRFGNLSDASTIEAMRIFTEKGYLENPKDPRGKLECPYNYGTSQYKRFWTSHENKVNEFGRVREERKGLAKLLNREIRCSMARNITLNAFADSFGDHFNIFRKGERYRVTEINKPYEYDENDELQPKSKRKFDLVPSELMFGVLYTMPDDERSSHFLYRVLERFNSEYPDRIHIPQARENYFPHSILKPEQASVEN